MHHKFQPFFLVLLKSWLILWARLLAINPFQCLLCAILCVCVCMCTHVRACMHACMHVCDCVCMCTCMHAVNVINFRRQFWETPLRQSGEHMGFPESSDTILKVNWTEPFLAKGYVYLKMWGERFQKLVYSYVKSVRLSSRCKFIWDSPALVSLCFYVFEINSHYRSLWKFRGLLRNVKSVHLSSRCKFIQDSLIFVSLGSVWNDFTVQESVKNSEVHLYLDCSLGGLSGGRLVTWLSSHAGQCLLHAHLLTRHLHLLLLPQSYLLTGAATVIKQVRLQSIK